MNIEFTTYLALSMVMFLQYAIWGAWAPVLAARLLGPLKMSGQQTGWIYATLPIACIFVPLLAGWAADQYVNAEWVLIGAHAVGAVLLFVAARQSQFKMLMVVMLLYSACYAATLPLANSVLFRVEPNGATIDRVFIWAPVAWALVGWSLTGWRMTRSTQGDGSDCLYFAAGLSVLMVLASIFLTVVSPATPKAEGFPLQETLASLGDFHFLVFILVSMAVFGMMQFYFLGTAQFMQDAGVSSKHVPASMALAQIAQALATWFLLSRLTDAAGFKGAIVFGGVCWLLLYGLYVTEKPRWMIVAIQPFHGLAYVFFVIAGQLYTNTQATEATINSMQALIFAATTGVGLFLGTQFAGAVMDTHSQDGRFQWAKVWAVPAAVVLTGVLVLLALFEAPPVG